MIPTELEYERLLKVCFLCKRLTHDHTRCPSQAQPQAQNQHPTYTIGRGSQKRDTTEGLHAPKRGGPKKQSTHTGISLSRSSQPSGSNPRTAANPPESRKRTDLKGKGVARGSSQVWKQKTDSKTPSRSEATPKSSRESQGTQRQQIHILWKEKD